MVLETGLGGRLDATNSVEKKLATVITSIGYDHMEYLGDTLTAIAGEKAGIMRPGTPVIYRGHFAGCEDCRSVAHWGEKAGLFTEKEFSGGY